MKAALHRIFRKNLLLLVLLLAVMIAAKILAVYSTERNLLEFSYLDAWVKDCQGMDDEALKSYANGLAVQLSENQRYREKASGDFVAFNTAYSNRTEMQQLIAFARNGEGVLGSALPPNYEENLDLYAKMQPPAVINGQILKRYFSLQTMSVVPVIVLLLGAVMWGAYYESGIYRLSETTAEGKRYRNTMYGTLAALGVVIFAANELYDLCRSGLLEDSYLWACPVQSYGSFNYTQACTTIGGALAMTMLSKFLGVLILTKLAMLLAGWQRTVKETVISALLALIILLFLGRSLVNTPYFPLIQLGVTDWQELIGRATVLLPLRIDSFSLGVILTGVTEILLAACCCTRKK